MTLSALYTQWKQPTQRRVIGVLGLFSLIVVVLVIRSHSTLQVPDFVSYNSHEKIEDRNLFEDVFNSTLVVRAILYLHYHCTFANLLSL